MELVLIALGLPSVIIVAVFVWRSITDRKRATEKAEAAPSLTQWVPDYSSLSRHSTPRHLSSQQYATASHVSASQLHSTAERGIDVSDALLMYVAASTFANQASDDSCRSSGYSGGGGDFSGGGASGSWDSSSGDSGSSSWGD